MENTASASTIAAAPRSQALRHAGAILAGLATNFILGPAIDAILHATQVFPAPGRPMSNGLFALAVGYRAVIGVLGAYLTARLAPSRPMRDALILGGVGIALATAGTIAMWGQGPLWYPLLLVAITLPACWVGARLAR
jgi:hypothetical protein